MFRNVFKVALIAAACSLYSADEAHAQWSMFGGGEDIFTQNMIQDQRFMNWAWQGSQHVAAMIPDDVPPSEIIAHMQPCSTEVIYGPGNAHYYELQRRREAVMNDVSLHNRDRSVFVNPADGSSIVAPNGPAVWRDPAGYFYHGEVPTDPNNMFWGLFQ